MTAPLNGATDQAVDFDELLDDPAVAQAAEDAESRYDLLDQLVHSRKSAGLTQKHVALSMETTQSAVSDFENGYTDPHLSTIQRYARAVGARISLRIEGHLEVKGTETAQGASRLNIGASERLGSGYFAVYAQCGTAGRRSNYAKAA